MLRSGVGQVDIRLWQRGLRVLMTVLAGVAGEGQVHVGSYGGELVFRALPTVRVVSLIS